MGRASHQRVIMTRWWRLGWARTGAGEKIHQRVIMTRWWLEQGGPGRGRSHQRVRLVGGGCEEGGTGLGRANHQRVITTHWWQLGWARTGVGESKPPMSHNDSLVAVGAGEDRGWGEKPPTSKTCWWQLGWARTGAGQKNHQRVVVAGG